MTKNDFTVKVLNPACGNRDEIPRLSCMVEQPECMGVYCQECVLVSVIKHTEVRYDYVFDSALR